MKPRQSPYPFTVPPYAPAILDGLRDEPTCRICSAVLIPGQLVYATGRGKSLRLYCSERCADPRSCAACPHPQRQHDARGCFAPVVDRRGNEDACGCRTARMEP